MHPSERLSRSAIVQEQKVRLRFLQLAHEAAGALRDALHWLQSSLRESEVLGDPPNRFGRCSIWYIAISRNYGKLFFEYVYRQVTIRYDKVEEREVKWANEMRYWQSLGQQMLNGYGCSILKSEVTYIKTLTYGSFMWTVQYKPDFSPSFISSIKQWRAIVTAVT